MIVTIDSDSVVPVYEQLLGQLRRLIASGALGLGTRLPTIRQLASDLEVAPATIARVYELLAIDGWVTGSGRRGTLVALQPPVSPLRDDVRHTFSVAVDAGTQLGLSRDELRQLFEEAIQARS